MSYRRTLLWAGGKDTATTVKPDGVRKAQRAWPAYRDSFTRFTAQRRQRWAPTPC